MSTCKLILSATPTLPPALAIIFLLKGYVAREQQNLHTSQLPKLDLGALFLPLCVFHTPIEICQYISGIHLPHSTLNNTLQLKAIVISFKYYINVC